MPKFQESYKARLYKFDEAILHQFSNLSKAALGMECIPPVLRDKESLCCLIFLAHFYRPRILVLLELP